MAKKMKATEVTHWHDKACVATAGTRFGAILRCAMKRDLDAEPRFVGKAAVTSDGFIMCDYVSRAGDHHHGAFVGEFTDLERNVDGLAKHLRLGDAEKEELRTLVTQSWIGVDYRG